MRRLSALLLAVITLSTMFSAVLTSEAANEPAELKQPAGVYFDGKDALEPVVLGNTEQKVWEGNVPNNTINELGATGLTFVYKVDGVETPIKTGAWDAGFNGKNWSSSNWFWTNQWIGIWANQVVEFKENGLYYTYLPSRIAASGPVLIKDVTHFTLFKDGYGDPVIKNNNENATLQMLAILENNLEVTVNFYDTDRKFIGTATYKYTDGPVVEEGSSIPWTNTTASHGLLKTPVELASGVEGMTLPYKPTDDKYKYDLIFKDKDGNVVEGVYKSLDLYADFVPVDKTIADYKFLDAEGNVLESVRGKKGDKASLSTALPVKASDADYNYTFKCWSVDGTEVDLATYKLTNDTTVFVPIYVPDKILKVDITADNSSALSEGDKITFSFKLNRSSLTTDVLADKTEAITGGKVTVTYDTTKLAVRGYKGTVTLGFTEVASDGTVNATMEATVVTPFTTAFDVTAVATAKSVAFPNGVETPADSCTVTTVGIREGLYDLGTYNYNEKANLIIEPFIPAEKSSVLTIVLEVKGLNGGKLNLGGVLLSNNGHISNNSANMYHNDDIAAGTKGHQMGTVTEDGIYALQIGAYVGQWKSATYDQINGITFADPASYRGGLMEFFPAEGDTESVPTITYHAVMVGVAGAEIVYKDADGNDILTGSYKDSDPGMWGVELYAIPSVESVYTGDTDFVKESGIDEVEYVFDGWADKNGNKVDTLYGDAVVYPYFKLVDKRTTYNVIFKNFDDSVLCEVTVPEGVVPEYPATRGTPKRPSTDTNSYMFTGWTPALVATPVTPEADGGFGGDIVYTAQYKKIERRYDVIYYDEDGVTVLDEELYLVYGSATSSDVIPVKATDAQYSYVFDKWVGMDGEEVDLSRVTADLEVKARYKATLNKCTVTFIDEDGYTILGTSTVDYGTPAIAPDIEDVVVGNTVREFHIWLDEIGYEPDIAHVTSDMTVYATYTSRYKPINPNEVIPAWAKDAVKYVVMNNIMNGMDGSFKPDVNMSRAMVVTVLYRYLGSPEVEIPDGYVEFADNADKSSWYYGAVVWAKVNGVVNGKEGNKFDPNGNVTREEFVVILYRFANQVMGEDVQYGRAAITGFADRTTISSWAHSAVKWAYATKDDLQPTIPGIIQYEKTQYITGKGTKNGKPLFAPKANATRGEVATMLYRYMTAERIAKA